MAQLENIEAIEKRLWSAADTLRANSNYASNEYFMPVMGLVFLRHAYSRYLAVKDGIEASLPSRGGVKRELTKEDFSKKSAIFLQKKAQFDYLVGLKDSDDRARAIINAMESIEADYETLRGVLPKQEYRELDNKILGELLRSLNPEELKKVTGDVFGRIYEYFLTQFADQKAHDGGEFFTPISLVSLIANVLEPKRGTVLDPACGSGGMFVQSARFVENLHENPNDKLNFCGLEKNGTTINLAKMNLAVHGLVGDIKKAITYYEDPHNLHKKADFVMANPPFNVDEIDAEKIKNDPRLPFGLPGVNKKETIKELTACIKAYKDNCRIFFKLAEEKLSWWKKQSKDKVKLSDAVKELVLFADENNKLIKEAELMFRLINRLIDECLNTHNAKESEEWKAREVVSLKKQTEEVRDIAVNQLKIARYFYHQADWLIERFPEEILRDVEGLVKLVDKEDLKENDWSLTPGRYVGVAPEEEDPDFDFGEAMCAIHEELEGLNVKAGDLAKKISGNFRKFGI